jgi:hypothetical protein
MREIITYIIWFIGVVLLQAFVFENLVLPGGFSISFYIIFLLILPFNTRSSILMLIGFALGLSIDAFSDTFGLNASSAVTLAAIRPTLFKWFEPASGYNETQTPNLKQMGWNWTIKAYALAILGFYTWFYALGFLRMSGFWFTASKIIYSSLATLLVILMAQILFRRKAKQNEI